MRNGLSCQIVKMNSKHIVRPENCTGCALCANVCPKDAIVMQWNTEGFLSPRVDAERCVQCGLCVKQCPALGERPTYEDNPDTVVSFGAWNKDEEIHLKSSSGGVFSAVATEVLARGGCVFGVVWETPTKAVYAKAETEEELAPMRGSKYTQAVPGYVYRQVLAELKAQRPVLFSGTPCAVNALRKYLKVPYENLLTIDIVCHGTPSHLLLEKFVGEDEARSGKKITHVSFRDKPEGWQRFHVTRHYEDGSRASCAQQEDVYMGLFLCDKALNVTCYNCAYAHFPRRGDISLADYWGVERNHPDWPIEQGISAVIANTDKGLDILRQVAPSVQLQEEPFSLIYAGQGVVYIRPPKQVPTERSAVLTTLQQLPLQTAYHRYVLSVKIGPFRVLKTSLAGQAQALLMRICRRANRLIGKLRRQLS